jgi:peptidoglycan hydrolase CwlO-like protein
MIKMDVSKKEAAAISAAIAAYLAKPRLTESPSSVSDVQKTLELLLEKFSQFEKQIDELDSTVNEIKVKVERMGK